MQYFRYWPLLYRYQFIESYFIEVRFNENIVRFAVGRSVSWFQDAVLVGEEEVIEVGDLVLHLAPLVGVADRGVEGLKFDRLGDGFDVVVGAQGFADVGDVLVLQQAQAAGVIDERVAGDARLLVVGLAEAAVDDDGFAAGLDRALALLDLDRDVAIDDVARGRRPRDR